MKFQQWPKRDPDKNYFKVPNEVFHIGLSYPEISIYCYLLSIEDRETYQCYPSDKTIGKALGMSENTVRKYVAMLEADEQLKKLSETALQQINDKKYETELTTAGVRTIYKYGVAFSGKKVEVAVG